MNSFFLLLAFVIHAVSCNDNDGNDGDKPLSFEKRQLCFCIQHGDSFEIKHFPYIQVVHYGQSLSCHFFCLVNNGVLTFVLLIKEEISKHN